MVAVPKSWFDSTEADLLGASLKPSIDSLTTGLQTYQQRAKQWADSAIADAQQAAAPVVQPKLPSPTDIFGSVQDAAAPVVAAAAGALKSPSDIFGMPASRTANSQQNASPDSSNPPTYGARAPTQQPAPSGAATAGAVGMPQASAPDESMSDEDWARSEARRLHIDPQKAVDVGNTEGGFTVKARQNMQGAPAYSPYQLYIGGSDSPGLGDEALSAGIDPRDPAQSKRAITFALEHAARNGWGAFQGAKANGIGDWDGIGQGATNPVASGQTVSQPPSGTPAPMPSSAYSGPYTQQGLADAGDPDAWAKCGPVAAYQFAQRMGRNPTPAEVEKLARDAGWTGAAGMAGLQSEANLLQGMNIAAHATRAVDWNAVVADVQRGNPVILELPGHEGHYVTAQGYDPQTGRLDFGSTVGDLVAAHHGTQFTPDELVGLGWGSPSGALFLDNPATPAPSVVAGRSAPPTAGAGPTAPAGSPLAPAAASGVAQPTAAAGASSASDTSLWSPDSGSSQQPAYQTAAGRSGGGGVMQRTGQPLDPNDPTSPDAPSGPAGSPPPMQWAPPRMEWAPPRDQPPEPDWSQTTDDLHRPTPLPSTAPYAPWNPDAASGQVGEDPSTTTRLIPTMPNGAADGSGPDPYHQQRRSLPVQQNAPALAPWQGDQGDAMQYRQPLTATPGPDTTTGGPQPYDPRDADQGAHEWHGSGDSFGAAPGSNGTTPTAESVPGGASLPIPSGIAPGDPTSLVPTGRFGNSDPTDLGPSQDAVEQAGRSISAQPIPYDLSAASGPPYPQDAAGAISVPTQPSQQPMSAQADQPAESPLKPLYDLGGRIIGYVHTAAEGIKQEARAIPADLAAANAARQRASDTFDQNNESARQAVEAAGNPVVQPMEAGLRNAADYIDRTTGAPPGTTLQATQDVSQVMGPQEAAVARGFEGIKPYVGPGVLQRGADALTEGARGLRTGIRGAISANAERVAQADRAAGEAGSTTANAALGAGGDTSRMYHGTAEAFASVDPGKLDRNGLFGPGYYMTDNPDVASSYAGARSQFPGGISPKSEIRARRLTDEISQADHHLANPRLSDSDREWFQASRDRAIAERDRVTSQGPNVRPLDVPQDLNLLDAEAPVGEQGVAAVKTALGDSPVARDAAPHLDPAMTGTDLHDVLSNVESGDATYANDVLARAGYDGISYNGGQRVPLMDAAGNPIQHNVTMVFPDALPRVRQAYSGEYGGATIGAGGMPRGAEPGSTGGPGRLGTINRALAQGVRATVGGGIGAVANQQANPDDPNAAVKGFAAGALLPPLLQHGAGRLARALGHEAGAEGGMLATFGASPNYKPPTAAAVAAEEARGPVRGQMLNRGVTAPASAVPRLVRAANTVTDDRAGMRWAENVLSDAAGSPRMRENDPARPSTQSRVNSGSIANERIQSELEPAIVAAGQGGLQHELPQYLEDMHQKDILDEFYSRAHQGVMDERAQAIATAQANGAQPAVIARMQAKATADADRAGVRAMRTRQGGSADMTPERIEARLQGQENRLKANGAWDQLQESAQAVWDHNAQTRQRLVDAGEMDPQQAAELAAKYPHYVPTVPASHLVEGGGPVASSSVAVSRGTTPVVKALDDVGTSGERLNPIVASRNNTIVAERAIQRNNVARAFAQMMDDALQASPGTMSTGVNHRTFLGGGVNVSYMDGGKPVTMSVPKVVADGLESAASMGVNPNSFAAVMKWVTQVVTSTLTARRPSFVPVNVLRDATDYATRTMAREGNNPLKLPAIMGTWADEAGKATLDIMKAQANVRGASGAAVGAAFGAAQGDENTTIKDRLIHAGEGAVAGTFLLGANHVPVTTGRAAEYLAQGGGQGGLNSGWRAGQRWYRDVMRDGGAPLKTMGDVAHTLADWAWDAGTMKGIVGVNERAELISRTAAMRRAEAQGVRGPVTTSYQTPGGNTIRMTRQNQRIGNLDPVEAMIAGRDSSYDADRAGTLTRAWNGNIPFLNATVQGAAQFTRLFKQNPIGTTAAITTTLAPVMLATEYWNRSDPQRAQAYDDVPQYIKDSGLVVMAPWAGSDNRGQRPNYLWLPTEVLTPFIVGGRAAMQHLDSVVPGVQPSQGRSDANPNSAAPQALSALNEALSIFYPVRGDSAASIGSTLVPPIAKQAIELSQNKDMFRGGAIQSPGQDERASAFGHTVAGAANNAGRALGNGFLQDVHPSQVDYLARQVPAYGDIISGASDMVKPTPYKQTEQGRVANEPFVGGVASRFVRDAGGANLERAQGQMMTPTVQRVLNDARMRPSDVSLDAPSDYQNAPLTRGEQLRWQRAFRGTLNEELGNVRDARAWEDPNTRQQAVKDAVSKARDRAAKDALDLSSSDVKDRVERAQQLKRRALAQ